MGEIDRYGPEGVRRMIIGSKCDCEGIRTVSSEEAQAYAASVGVPFFEVSAKTGENVELAFTSLVEGLLKEELRQPKNGIKRLLCLMQEYPIKPSSVNFLLSVL